MLLRPLFATEFEMEPVVHVFLASQKTSNQTRDHLLLVVHACQSTCLCLPEWHCASFLLVVHACPSTCLIRTPYLPKRHCASFLLVSVLH